MLRFRDTRPARIAFCACCCATISSGVKTSGLFKDPSLVLLPFSSPSALPDLISRAALREIVLVVHEEITGVDQSRPIVAFVKTVIHSRHLFLCISTEKVRFGWSEVERSRGPWSRRYKLEDVL
ncbi:hypothetical protein MRB53_039227 [Persea americana]|nr:hypothetical protein MRB53_039227 [Persea americana]